MANGFGEHICPICGTVATELHHIVFKSQVKQLENCKLNHIYLCANCYRGTKGVHGKNGHELDKKLKLQFQNKLEILFIKNHLNRSDIKSALVIKDNALDKLLKTLQVKEDKYIREDVIRACMGGKIILEE